MKRLVCLALALLMTAVCFTGCANGNKKENDTTVSPSGTETTVEIKAEDLSKYTVIKPEGCSSVVTDAAKSIRDAINTAYSLDIEIKNDLVVEGVYDKSEYEILVGNCGREESTDFNKPLRNNDFGYRIYGNRVVVSGKSNEAITLAAEKFICDIVNRKSENGVFVATADNYLKAETYSLDSLKISDTEIYDYSIVYATSNKLLEKTLAEKLQKNIAAICGYVLDVKSDKSSAEGKEILIGETNRITDEMRAQKKAEGTLTEKDYYIGYCDSSVWVSATNIAALMAGVNKLTEYFTPKNGEKTMSVEFDDGFIATYGESNIRVMSFNVKVAAPSEARLDSVAKRILEFMPDSVGLQEVSNIWLRNLKEKLSDKYDYVGTGREPNRTTNNYNEGCQIFYLKDKFNLVETKTMWMSDTPDVQSKYAESEYIRIVTYAILERKSDGLKFLHVNTHLDTIEAARVKQAKFIMKLIDTIGDYPTFLTGDFNSKPNTEPYNTIQNSFMTNSSTVKLSGVDADTNINFEKNTTKVIDYVFVSDASVIVSYYKVCNDESKYPFTQTDSGVQYKISDHYPVYIDAVIID